MIDQSDIMNAYMQTHLKAYSIKSPPGHITWDWNGTLFNDAGLCLDIFNNMLERRNLPVLSMDNYLRIFDFPVKSFYVNAGVDLEAESFDDVGTEFIEEYERRRLEPDLHDGVEAILESVNRKGVTQSVLSAYKNDTLEQLLNHFGIRNYFDEVVGNDDYYAAGKLEKGRAWAESTGRDPQEILIIGDTKHDYEVANTIGS